MNNQNPHTSDARPTVEELVAYLDGELDAAAHRRIEDRLAVDGALRDQLRGLQATWDCLDELPATNVDEKFARTTIAMATVVASEEISEMENRQAARRAARGVVMAAGLVASLLVGLLIAAAIWPDPNARLLGNLHVLVRLDALRAVDRVEFLREMDRQDLFPPTADVQDAGPALEQFPALESRTIQTEWLKQLPVDRKGKLADQQQRLSALSQPERQRVNRLAQEISRDPRASELLAVLDRYHDWLLTLPPGQRADLIDLEPVQRIREIGSIQQRQARREKKQQHDLAERIKPLSLADVEKMHRWMRTRVEARLQQRVFGHAGHVGLPNFSHEEIRKLVASLSEPAQKKLQEAGSHEERKRMLKNWMRIALLVHWKTKGQGRPFSKVTQAELERHFTEDLSSDERARLLALSPDKMQEVLRNSYLKQAAPRGHDRPRFPRPHDRARDEPGRGHRGPPHRRPADARDRPGPPPFSRRDR